MDLLIPTDSIKWALIYTTTRVQTDQNCVVKPAPLLLFYILNIIKNCLNTNDEKFNSSASVCQWEVKVGFYSTAFKMFFWAFECRDIEIYFPKRSNFSQKSQVGGIFFDLPFFKKGTSDWKGRDICSLPHNVHTPCESRVNRFHLRIKKEIREWSPSRESNGER